MGVCVSIEMRTNRPQCPTNWPDVMSHKDTITNQYLNIYMSIEMVDILKIMCTFISNGHICMNVKVLECAGRDGERRAIEDLMAVSKYCKLLGDTLRIEVL